MFYLIVLTALCLFIFTTDILITPPKLIRSTGDKEALEKMYARKELTTTLPSTTTLPPSTTTLPPTGGNPYVDAINKTFGLNIGYNSSQDACTKSHAEREPTGNLAHTVWRSGDKCNGGRGVIWYNSPNPVSAANWWLGSPTHSSIIRSAKTLACGAGPSSVVCISYQ